MKIAEIKRLIEADKFQEALSQVDHVLAQITECPYLWNLRGDLIQMLEISEGCPLEEAAKSYAHALELNPNDLEALEGLAHFYDAIDRKPVEAKKYATAYVEKARKTLVAMERILSGE